MKLVHIILENVRSHKYSEVLLNKGITVINGRTGSGKSSILMGVDYALFGSANLSNDEIMRRGAKQMRVELKFTHQNSEYTIIRGLIRKNNRIVIDNDNLKVLKDGKQINVLSRARDVDNIICEILGIPESVKASEMFQITTYTKQDEIRKLLEMRKEERQEYIDRMLQLSKYKTTFENLKKVVDFFKNELSEVKQTSEFLKSEKDELEGLKNDLSDKMRRVEDNEKKLKTLNKALESKKEKKEEVEKRLKDLKRLVDKKREGRSELKSLEEQKSKFKTKLKRLEEKRDNISSELKSFKSVKDEEWIQKCLNKLESELKFKNKVLHERREELSEVEEASAKCPLCKQEITEKHRNELIKGFKKDINDLKERINNLEDEVKKKKIMLKKAGEKTKLNRELERVNNNIREYEQTLTDLNKSINSLNVEDFSELEDRLRDLEKEKEELLDKDRDLFSKKKSIKDLMNYLNKEVSLLKNKIKDKKEVIGKYEKRVKDRSELEYLLTFLNNLRGYVKDVRSVIRRKFLTDFKHEFQNKFEEIRNEEEEYSVEVNADYEPIAYTARGEEVSVNYLSGGEKTSVALAYRLSLSDLAAQMSKVVPTELLILDEPTTGFDTEDIKALPEALRNITSIPQIIIVTHETLLKGIADTVINVRKKGNNSIIEY